jgi:hypothetical protein
VYSDLDTLTRLLDKAERWWLRNELISPVLLKYVPQGSTLHASGGTTLQAIVLGRAGTNELNGVDLPSNLNDAGMIFEIRGVKVLCLRRGAWTGLTETPSASAAVTNPGVMTKAFASTHTINSPVEIVVNGFDKTATPTISAGFLVVGSNVDDIQFSDQGGSIVAGFTNVPDAANLAKFGSVLRYTPTSTAATTSGTSAITTAMSGTIALYAALRNNSGTTSFLLRGNITGNSGTSSTPYQLIDTSTLNPRIVYLGMVNGTGLKDVSWTAIASAAAGTLDMDYILCVNLRNETVAVVAHDSVAVSLISAGAVTLNFKFNPIADQNPSVYASGTNNNAYIPYRGPLPLLSVGINIYALWMATNSNFWCFTNNVGAAVTNTITVTRYRSYLSPQ